MKYIKEAWAANGWLLRQLRCTDFSTFGQDNTPELKLLYPEVPYGTAIIDKIYLPELDLLLKQIERYWGLTGKDYDQEREKQRRETALELPGKFEEFVIKITSGGIEPCIAELDGTGIRAHIDPEFLQGGNDAVYHWFPYNHIGFETAIISQERQYIVLHEGIERVKMTHYDLSYRQAHYIYANRAEKKARRRDPLIPGHYPGDKNYHYCESWEEFKVRFEMTKL